jgi:hypothetical protein
VATKLPFYKKSINLLPSTAMKKPFVAWRARGITEKFFTCFKWAEKHRQVFVLNQ